MIKKLGEIAFITKLAGFEHTSFIQGNSTHEKENPNDVPLFIGKTVKKGKIDKDFDWYISRKISDSLRRSQLTEKCLVLPYVGTLGDLAIFDGTYSAHLGSNIAKIELKDNSLFTEEFVYYFLKSPYGQKCLLREVQGGIQKNITMDAIRNVELPSVSLQEQNVIVATLKMLDDKIDSNNHLIIKLEDTARLIYDYWFTQFDFPDENGNPYRSSGGKMVWNDELKREIPEGWKVGNLYNIANFINGLACQKHRPGNDDAGLPVIKIKEMHEGINNDTERVSSDIPARNKIEEGDILFSWSASLEVMYWANEDSGLNQHIFKVIPRYADTSEFVYQCLSLYVQVFVKIAESRKTTMGHITTDHLNQSLVVLPPVELMVEFQNKTDALRSESLRLNKETTELVSLRDWLLPMLMNGQVKVG